MSMFVLSIISMHVRCDYNSRKETIGYDTSITFVREVRKGDPLRLKEPLWWRQRLLAPMPFRNLSYAIQLNEL